MGRFLTVPFVLLALLLASAGALAAAIHIRSRQARLDQELSQAWMRLGSGLRDAAQFVHLASDPVFEPRELAMAASDSSIQARLDLIGNRIDSVCRAEDGKGRDSESLDSLRESVRRDRERLGLALARYREEKDSFLGKRLLAGFPTR